MWLWTRLGIAPDPQLHSPLLLITGAAVLMESRNSAGRLALSVGPALLEALIASAAVQQLCPDLHAALHAASAEATGARTGTRAFGRSLSVAGAAVTDLDSDGCRTRSQARAAAANSQ
jgi:hypothetical protein